MSKLLFKERWSLTYTHLGCHQALYFQHNHQPKYYASISHSLGLFIVLYKRADATILFINKMKMKRKAVVEIEILEAED